MSPRWLVLVAGFGLVSPASWLSYSYVVRDRSRVGVRAVLRQVTCVLQASLPSASAGPSGPEAIPPVWFERGTVTAVLGSARLWLHEFPYEPAEVTVRALIGDVTIAVPDQGRSWNVRLEPRTLLGRVRDDRADREPDDDRPVYLVVTGFVAVGRVRLVSLGEDDR